RGALPRQRAAGARLRARDRVLRWGAGLALRARLRARAVLGPAAVAGAGARAGSVPGPLHLGGGGLAGDLLGLLDRLLAVRLAVGPGVLLRGLLRGLGRLALGAATLHLGHRGALVVQAELPGASAPGDHLEARGALADRADLLDLVEALDPLRQREGLVTRVGRVGVVAVPALAAAEALAGLARLHD